MAIKENAFNNMNSGYLESERRWCDMNIMVFFLFFTIPFTFLLIFNLKHASKLFAIHTAIY